MVIISDQQQYKNLALQWHCTIRRNVRMWYMENHSRGHAEIECIPPTVCTYLDHVTNEEVLSRAGSTRLQDIVAERRFRLAGHILRLPDQRHSKTAIRWTPAGGTCRRGHPKKIWRRTFQDDLGRVHMTWNEAEIMASDRSCWRQTAAQCAVSHGRNQV